MPSAHPDRGGPDGYPLFQSGGRPRRGGGGRGEAHRGRGGGVECHPEHSHSGWRDGDGQMSICEPCVLQMVEGGGKG